MADKNFDVKISATTDDFSKSIDEAESKSNEFSDSLEDSSDSAKEAQARVKELTEELRKMQKEALGATSSNKQFSDSMGTTRDKVDSTENSSNRFNKQMQRLSSLLGGDVPESTKEAYKELYNLHNEARKATRYYGKYSQEAMSAKNAIAEFALGLDDTTFKQVFMRSQLGLTDAQLQQQANSIKLNARMTKLMGSQTEILTQKMQGLAKHGIKPEDLLPPSTPGQFQLLGETIGAVNNPLYKLSGGFRTLGGRMEKVVKGWSAQKMAIKLAQGDMVKYGLLQRGISAGMMNMTTLFPLLGAGAIAFYAKLVSMSIGGDEKLQKLADTVKNKLGKAFEPLMEIVKSATEVVLKFVGKVADIIIKFNEAHPIIAKVASAIALLAPAMTLLLLPLGLGVGLINGWKLALNSLWTMIGPFVTMIGTASSTFLVLATTIGVVAGAFMYLWKTNESFKNGVTKAWDFLKEKASTVFNTIATYLTETLPNAYKQGGIEGVFNSIYTVIQSALSNITTLLPQWIQKGFEIITNLLLGINQALPNVYAKSTELISKLMEGITTMMPVFVQTAITLIQSWLTALSNNLPIVLNAGVKILQILVQGIISVLPMVVTTASNIISTFLDFIAKNLPNIVNTGVNMVTSLTDGVLDNLPAVIEAVTQILDTFVDFIDDNLPMIIDAGIEIVTTLANSLIDNLPQIIAATVKLVFTINQSIIDNLPKIISAAIRIVGALVEGLIQCIPKILSAGIKLIVGLCNGLIQSIPKVKKAAGDVIKRGIDTIKNKLPSFRSMGKDLMAGLAKGILNGASNVVKSISSTVKSVIAKGEKLLGIGSPSKVFKQFGKWTTEGYAIGVNRGETYSTRAVEDFANNSINTFTTTALPSSTNNNNTAADYSTYTININAGNLNNEQDLYKLAEIIDKKLAEIKLNKSLSKGGGRVVY